MDGIGRRRRVDLAQGVQEEPGVSVSRQTLGRDLRAIGVARPPPAAQDDEASEAFNKTSATSSTTSAANGAASR